MVVLAELADRFRVVPLIIMVRLLTLILEMAEYLMTLLGISLGLGQIGGREEGQIIRFRWF